MLNNRSKVSIALIIFYFPAAISATILLFHRHGRPRQAWICLLAFSLIRIACGIVVILYGNNPRNIGLAVTSLILLNAGLFPLVNATVGLLRLIASHDMKNDTKFRNGCIASRVLFAAGIVLIVAGGSLSVDDPSDANMLAKAGYIIIAIFIVCLVILQGYFWHMRASLSASSIKIMREMAAATPFLIVRIAYLFLSVFHPDHGKWNALQGAIGPYVAMVLVMEYVVVCLYLMTGFRIPATKRPEVYGEICRTEMGLSHMVIRH